MKRATTILAFDGNRWRAAIHLGTARRRGELVHRVQFYKLRQKRSGRWVFDLNPKTRFVRTVLGEGAS